MGFPDSANCSSRHIHSIVHPHQYMKKKAILHHLCLLLLIYV